MHAEQGTHLLQRHWGSTVVSERPTEARKAKGQASSIMNAAMSRRMGNNVTVINAICKRLKKAGKELKKEIRLNTVILILCDLTIIQMWLSTILNVYGEDNLCVFIQKLLVHFKLAYCAHLLDPHSVCVVVLSQYKHCRCDSVEITITLFTFILTSYLIKPFP